jgi:hypothetical protein
MVNKLEILPDRCLLFARQRGLAKQWHATDTSGTGAVTGDETRAALVRTEHPQASGMAVPLSGTRCPGSERNAVLGAPRPFRITRNIAHPVRTPGPNGSSGATNHPVDKGVTDLPTRPKGRTRNNGSFRAMIPVDLANGAHCVAPRLRRATRNPSTGSRRTAQNAESSLVYRHLSDCCYGSPWRRALRRAQPLAWRLQTGLHSKSYGVSNHEITRGPDPGRHL